MFSFHWNTCLLNEGTFKDQDFWWATKWTKESEDAACVLRWHPYTALCWQKISLQLYWPVIQSVTQLISFYLFNASSQSSSHATSQMKQSADNMFWLLVFPCTLVCLSQNCLIRMTSRGREALVTDFGLAREVVELPVKDPGRKLSLVGSAFWMAPEMLRGEPYDRKVTDRFPS